MISLLLQRRLVQWFSEPASHSFLQGKVTKQPAGHKPLLLPTPLALHTLPPSSWQEWFPKHSISSLHLGLRAPLTNDSLPSYSWDGGGRGQASPWNWGSSASGLSSFPLVTSHLYAGEQDTETCSHNCQQIYTLLPLVILIMDFYASGFFIRKMGMINPLFRKQGIVCTHNNGNDKVNDNSSNINIRS